MRRRWLFPLFAIAIAVAVWLYDRATAPEPKAPPVAPARPGTAPGDPPTAPSMRAIPPPGSDPARNSDEPAPMR